MIVIENLDIGYFEKINFIEIQTLGRFSIKYNDHEVSHLFENSLKLSELLKYFISNRDEFLPTEKIINEMWPESEFSDPKRTLRALIFRLRKLIKSFDSKIGAEIISFSCDCYKFDAINYCKIDIETFETRFKLVSKATMSDKKESIPMYMDLIKTYNCGYLCKTSFYEWLVPIKNHYHHMYLHSCSEILDYLSEKKYYQEILDLSEEIFKQDLYFEYAHQHYINSLIKLGESKNAQTHLEYLKKIFDREIGSHSTEIINRISEVLIDERPLKELKSKPKRNDLELFPESIGPVNCSYEFFELYQKIESFRTERRSSNSISGIISIFELGKIKAFENPLSTGMESLKVILISNLRKGDLISQKSSSEFAINLSSSDDEIAGKVLDRVYKKFVTVNKALDISIKTNLYVLPYPEVQT